MGKKGGKKKRSKLAEYGRRVRRDPRMRSFPWLGWTIVLVPLDLFESRMVARMYVGTRYGFKPDEMVSLRARRLKMDGEPERIWWVVAIRQAVVEARMRKREAPTD